MRIFPARIARLVLVAACCLLAGAWRPVAAQGQGAVSAYPVDDSKTLRARAEKGDKRAAFMLGTRLATGHGGVKDDGEAVRWLSEAAEAGLAEAQYNLGIMYATGRGVQRDPRLAARWYTRAAEQGLPEAQFNLGTLYGTGEGVPRDEALAATWLQRAAGRGLAQAQYNLAVLYEHGRGVRLDADRALEWYQRAAEQGFEPAARRHAALAKRMSAPAEQSGAMPEPERLPAAAVVVPEPERPPVAEPAASRPVRPAAAPAGSEPAPRRAAGAPAAPETARRVADAPVAPEPARPAVAVAAPIPPPPPAPAQSPAAGPDADWVSGLDPERYTLQMASFAGLEEARRFAGTLPGDVPSGVYSAIKRGKRWYSVVLGTYPTYDAAKAAVTRLPESLRELKPWVRKVARIHAEMR